MEALIEVYNVESVSDTLANPPVDAPPRLDPSRPNYNIAPTDLVKAVITDRCGRRSLETMRWGFIPHWSNPKAAGGRWINARGESVAEKPMFKGSFERRRALLPADGFYEWARFTSAGGASHPSTTAQRLISGVEPHPQVRKSARQPYFIESSDSGELAFAAIWTRFHRHRGAARASLQPDTAPGSPEVTDSCAIVTTAAVGTMAEVHERMPIAVPAEYWGTWLVPGPLAQDAWADLLISPSPAQSTDAAGLHSDSHQDGGFGPYRIRPVSTAVNSVRNNGPELLRAAANLP